MARRVFYLHGFASSARSSKAAYLAERLSSRGIALECPDFNEPAFASLTITRMLEQLGRDVMASAPARVTLIGSSLGGALAILAAPRLASRVDQLVLLAPAVRFARPGHHLLPPERLEQWRREGSMPFFHYGYGEERRLDFSFYEDALRYDVFGTSFEQPTLVFQGLGDGSVDYRTVTEFAAVRPNVRLTLLEDDHQLAQSLPRIWSEIRAFLGLGEEPSPFPAA